MSSYPDLPITEAQAERVTGITTRVTRSGRPRSVSPHSQHPRRFVVRHELLTQSQAQQIETFYESNDTFTYTHLDGTTYDCIWAESGAVATPTGAGYWSAEAEFLGTPQ